MKTTIELPEDLLRAAKAIAGRRGTTLKAIITHALEREFAAPPIAWRARGLYLLALCVAKGVEPELPLRRVRNR